MLEYSRWKYVLILLVLMLSVFYALPNAFPQDPAVQVTANRGAKVDAAMQQRTEAALKKASVPFKSSEIEADGNLLLRTSDDDFRLSGDIRALISVAISAGSSMTAPAA